LFDVDDLEPCWYVRQKRLWSWSICRV